jgi:hypothetical protein
MMVAGMTASRPQMRIAVLAAITGLSIAPAVAAAQPAPAKKPAPAPGRPPKPGPKGGKPVKPPPPSPEKLRADKLFEDGRNYLAAKEYALACTAFEQSNQAEQAIGTLLNIALCYEQWGKVASAHRAYIEAERYAEQKLDMRSLGAHQKVLELAPMVPHLQLDVPADADISTVFLLDGKEIERSALGGDLLVDPGQHSIEARVPGRPPKTTTVELELGEKRRITIEVPRPEVKVIVTSTPRKKGRLYGGIAMLSGGALAVGTAGFVALLARRDYADAIGGCPELICESREAYDATQTARRRATYMTFVGAGGLVLAAAGLYMVLTSAGGKNERRVELVPLIHGDGGGLAIGGRL